MEQSIESMGKETIVNDSTLSPEQKKITADISYFLRRYLILLKKDLIKDSKVEDFEMKLDNFGEYLKKERGLNPEDYYLWYKISRASLPKDAKIKYFDTEDGEIEKFVMENLGGDVTELAA